MAAVKVRGTDKADELVDPASLFTEDPVVDAPAESKKAREKRVDDAASQLVSYQEQAIALFKRIGKGGALWEERGWEWTEPDWSVDPETWPPVAKLLWLFARLKHCQREANYLRHYAKWAQWCAVCGGEKPVNYETKLCVNHMDWVKQVKAIAGDLFGWAEVVE